MAADQEIAKNAVVNESRADKQKKIEADDDKLVEMPAENELANLIQDDEIDLSNLNDVISHSIHESQDSVHFNMMLGDDDY